MSRLQGAHYLDQFNGSYMWDAKKKKKTPNDTSESLTLDSFFSSKREVGSFGLLAADDSAEAPEQMYRRQKRITKTQTSIQLLLQTHDSECSRRSAHSDANDPGRVLSNSSTPPSEKHDCALLFVDISGFTKLSTMLEIEQLSKTINAYFQLIVETVQAFDGDIIKFAGDALFAQWQASPSRTLDGKETGFAGTLQGVDPKLRNQKAVRMAACCAAKIIELCSGYPVHEAARTSGHVVATLDVHCGVAFGEVLGVHVGGCDRMEYMILGDPIGQVAQAEAIAERGQVVASPQVLDILEEHDTNPRQASQAKGFDLCRKPEVIVSKDTDFIHRELSAVAPEGGRESNDAKYEALAKWDLSSLCRLQTLMSLYVHPVVVADNVACKYPSSRIKAQKRFQSEAELRDVFTVFISPCIDAKLSGNRQKDKKLLILLNSIMLITSRELARFKGHLRQYIVDDKGVVLIVNFGLRGSTFPKMVEKCGIPLATNVKSLLKDELDVDCRMGATYGKVYCGVVGGFDRHEYAVLGPSVNLSARLMANRQNHGFLVDGQVQKQAMRRKFQALAPIQAKGYSEPVPIFEPINQGTRRWKDTVAMSLFVGRETELSEIIDLSESVMNGHMRLVFITANSGLGKSSFLARVCTRAEELCKRKAVSHLIWGHICSEDDLFRPFGVFGTLFQQVISYVRRKERDSLKFKRSIMEDLSQIINAPHKRRPLAQLMTICGEVDMPERFVEIICSLVLMNSWSDASNKEKDATTRYLANIFLRLTINFDLVLLAIDDISSMDELSWQVLQHLYQHAHNLLVIGTSRPVSWAELDIDENFLHHLNTRGKAKGKFSQMELSPLSRAEVDQLVAKYLGKAKGKVDANICQTVYNQSCGVPHTAFSTLKKKYDMCEKLRGSLGDDLTVVTKDTKGIDGEHILHTVDSLPKSLRTHLYLGALLGPSFELLDMILVMERYSSIRKKNRVKHAESVHESLREAVTRGLLETSEDTPSMPSGERRQHPYSDQNVTFRFTHDNYRTKLLTVSLDSFKNELQGLIRSVQAEDAARNSTNQHKGRKHGH